MKRTADLRITDSTLSEKFASMISEKTAKQKSKKPTTAKEPVLKFGQPQIDEIAAHAAAKIEREAIIRSRKPTSKEHDKLRATYGTIERIMAHLDIKFKNDSAYKASRSKIREQIKSTIATIAKYKSYPLTTGEADVIVRNALGRKEPDKSNKRQQKDPVEMQLGPIRQPEGETFLEALDRIYGPDGEDSKHVSLRNGALERLFQLSRTFQTPDYTADLDRATKDSHPHVKEVARDFGKALHGFMGVFNYFQKPANLQDSADLLTWAFLNQDQISAETLFGKDRRAQTDFAFEALGGLLGGHLESAGKILAREGAQSLRSISTGRWRDESAWKPSVSGPKSDEFRHLSISSERRPVAGTSTRLNPRRLSDTELSIEVQRASQNKGSARYAQLTYELRRREQLKASRRKVELDLQRSRDKFNKQTSVRLYRRGNRRVAGSTFLVNPLVYSSIAQLSYNLMRQGLVNRNDIVEEIIRYTGAPSTYRIMIEEAVSAGIKSFNSTRPYIERKLGSNPEVLHAADLKRYVDEQTGNLRLFTVFGDEALAGIIKNPATGASMYAMGGTGYGLTHSNYGRSSWASNSLAQGTRFANAASGTGGLAVTVSMAGDSALSSVHGTQLLSSELIRAVDRGKISKRGAVDYVNWVLVKNGLPKIGELADLADKSHLWTFDQRKRIVKSIANRDLSRRTGVPSWKDMAQLLRDPNSPVNKGYISSVLYIDPKAAKSTASDLGAIPHPSYPVVHGGISLGRTSPLSLEEAFPTLYSEKRHLGKSDNDIYRSLWTGAGSRELLMPEKIWGKLPVLGFEDTGGFNLHSARIDDNLLEETEGLRKWLRNHFLHMPR